MAKDNRTLEHLSDNLDEELGWRRQELSILKKEIPSQINPKQAAFIRAGITMLYAHWEGFIKKAAENYINFVALRRLDLKELKPCFIVRIIRSKAIEQSKVHQEITRVEFILESLENRAYIPETSISTKFNLKFERFEDVLIEVGLDISDVEPFHDSSEKQNIGVSIIKREINDLVNDRNKIAHGKNLQISFIDFQQTYKTVMIAMETFKIRLFEAAQTKKYKR